MAFFGDGILPVRVVNSPGYISSLGQPVPFGPDEQHFRRGVPDRDRMLGFGFGRYGRGNFPVLASRRTKKRGMVSAAARISVGFRKINALLMGHVPTFQSCV